MRRYFSLLIILISPFFPSAIFACGDSLHRVGKGVAYRVYTAPLPGNLLVYANSNGAKKIAAQLEKSGHGVRMVESTEELAYEIRQGGYDVVIAPYSEHGAFDSAGTTTEADVVFLPVALDNKDKESAKSSYGHALVAKSNIKNYLRAIHRTLKQKT